VLVWAEVIACDATKKLFAHSLRVVFPFCGSEFTARPLALLHLGELGEEGQHLAEAHDGPVTTAAEAEGGT
jgi:hypothetical protein